MATFTNKFAATLSWTLSTTATTTSFTSVTNNYYIFAFQPPSGTSVSSVTATNGITFTLIKSNVNTLGLYVYGGLCTSGSSGTSSVVLTASTTAIGNGIIDQISGMNTSGTVVQSVAASAQTVTLAALTNSNPVYGAYCANISIPTAGTGYTGLGTGASNVYSEYKSPGTTTPSVTDSSGTGPSFIGIEISIPAATAAKNQLMMMGYGT